ncbi:hypothetical protein LNQ52_02540 [Klebsiella pneumoniae subsp. pneumoniae]|nr:hypothetical protein [Klebsiella pneumoniae subsp. pneumoniae]
MSKTWHHHGEACASLGGLSAAVAGGRGEADRRLLPHHAEGHRRA